MRDAKKKYNQIYQWLHIKLKRAELHQYDDRVDAFKEVIATMWALDQGLWDPDTHALDETLHPPLSWANVSTWAEGKDIKWSILCPDCETDMVPTGSRGEFSCPNEDCLLAFYNFYNPSIRYSEEAQDGPR